MSEGFGAFRKMSKKCPTTISPERSPLKNVKKMSRPYGVLKKCQKNVPRHCERHGSRRNETRGRILAVCVAKNPCRSGTEKMSPMPPGRRELPVQWARPERPKVVGPVFGCRSVSYTFLVFGVLI